MISSFKYSVIIYEVAPHQLGKYVRRFGLGKWNERGERLIQFASENDLLIVNSLFQNHPKGRMNTCLSPDGKKIATT